MTGPSHEPCPCGHRGCHDRHLVGIGKFVQGSGFTETEADEICRSLMVTRRMGRAARRHREEVPHDGREAFHSGWHDEACPHDPATVEAMLWRSDWWRANAEAFADHIGQVVQPSRDFVAGWSARDCHYDGYSDEAVENGHISCHWASYLQTGEP